MSPQLLRGAGSYFFEGSPVGCLLVHGMGSTPYQVRSLGEYLAWQGLTVLGIRLPGHGTTLGRPLPNSGLQLSTMALINFSGRARTSL